jgi:hypothetical protein
LVNGGASLRLGELRSNFSESSVEQLAVLSFFDGFDLSSEDANAILLENAEIFELDTSVQSSLTAKAESNGIGLLLLDDLLE